MVNIMNEAIWHQCLLYPHMTTSVEIKDEIEAGFYSRFEFPDFKGNETEFKKKILNLIAERIEAAQVFCLVHFLAFENDGNSCLFQIERSRIICPTAQKELHVSEIMNHQCTMSLSRLDIALTSECGKLVLYVEEAKMLTSDVGMEQVLDDIKQLVASMLSVVALSQWGLGQKPGSKPIFGLLVYPTIIYRVSIWKSSDSATGLMHKIENAIEPLMMGWVFEVFLRNYIQDYRKLQSAPIRYDFECHPSLWTCLNFNLGEPLRESSAINLGFLFRSNAHILKEFFHLTEEEDLLLNFCVKFDQIPPTQPLILKYLSSLLVFPPEQYLSPINAIILAENLARTCARQEKDHLAVQGDGIKSVYQEQSLVSMLSKIKHPYLGTVVVDGKHPIIVMRDVGPSLESVALDIKFRAKWKECRDLRSRFSEEVGESALSLVEKMRLCHNDIRTPNIAVQGESFCLIDFDMSRYEVASPQSRVLNRFRRKNSKDSRMMYTVAQIALVVFELETSTSAQQVSNVRKYWLSDAKIGKPAIEPFEAWVKSKGKAVMDVFCENAVDLDGPQCSSKDHFVRILHAILRL